MTVPDSDQPAKLDKSLLDRASAMSPRGLASLLVALDRDASLTPTEHNTFLNNLAADMSKRVDFMPKRTLAEYIADWQTVINDEAGADSQAEQAPYIQALSLIVARGTWPDTFLRAIAESILRQEGDEGVAYWNESGQSVKDPGVMDPMTGELAIVGDPMWGVWNATVRNPMWFRRSFLRGARQKIEYMLTDDKVPTRMTGVAVSSVFAVLNRTFQRGFDQASALAFIVALVYTDVGQMEHQREPIAILQAQIIAKARLLHSGDSPSLPEWAVRFLESVSQAQNLSDVVRHIYSERRWFAERELEQDDVSESIQLVRKALREARCRLEGLAKTNGEPLGTVRFSVEYGASPLQFGDDADTVPDPDYFPPEVESDDGLMAQLHRITEIYNGLFTHTDHDFAWKGFASPQARVEYAHLVESAAKRLHEKLDGKYIVWDDADRYLSD